MNMFVKLTWKRLLYIINVWCLPTGAQTHGYHSLTSYYASANGSPALDWQTSSDNSCFYNLRHQSKSRVSSILHNYPSYSKVSRKAHLSAHQLLQGKKTDSKSLGRKWYFSHSFSFEAHGFFFLKNLDRQALNYFQKDS